MTTPKYTETLCNIVQSGVNIFNFSYPIYEPGYRSTLESKIINHYYFREIGSETVGRFIFNLKSVMNEIMPKYNRLYKYFKDNEVNPLSNMYLKETLEIEELKTADEDNKIINDLTRNETGSTTNTHILNNTTIDSKVANNKKKFNDTAQGQELVLDNGYLTNMTNDIIDEDGTSTANESGSISTGNTNLIKDTGNVSESKGKTEDNKHNAVKIQSGYNGVSIGGALTDYLKNYEEVDNLIINELSVLFMRVY